MEDHFFSAHVIDEAEAPALPALRGLRMHLHFSDGGVLGLLRGGRGRDDGASHGILPQNLLGYGEVVSDAGEVTFQLIQFFLQLSDTVDLSGTPTREAVHSSSGSSGLRYQASR